MMKVRTLLAAVMVAVCLFSCVAYAETAVVESPTKPSVVLEQVVTATPAAENTEAAFVLEIVETELWSEKAVALHEQITALLTAEETGEAAAETEQAPLFTEEEIAATAAFLPEEYDAAQLAIAEYIPLTIINYTAEIGNVTAQFTVPGEYVAEDVVVAMFKALTEEESGWTALETKVVEGKIEVVFTQEVLELLSTNEAVLLILRGN